MRVATRMHGPALVTNSATTKYTVPTARKAIVRHVHVINPSAAPVTFTMSIGTNASGVRLFDAYSIGAGQILDHFCYYVLDVAEIIQALAGTTNILTLTINGDEAILS